MIFISQVLIFSKKLLEGNKDVVVKGADAHITISCSHLSSVLPGNQYICRADEIKKRLKGPVIVDLCELA